MKMYFKRLFDWNNYYRAVLFFMVRDFKRLLWAVFFLIAGAIQLPVSIVVSIFRPIKPHDEMGFFTPKRLRDKYNDSLK